MTTVFCIQYFYILYTVFLIAQIGYQQVASKAIMENVKTKNRQAVWPSAINHATFLNFFKILSFEKFVVFEDLMMYFRVFGVCWAIC